MTVKIHIKILSFILMASALVAMCSGCELAVPTYRKLTMIYSDGTKRVFVGRSVIRGETDIRYTRLDGNTVYFKGDYLIETVSKQYFDSYKPPAESRE